MAKKLTLNIDDDLIQFAHQYSRKTKQSISNIVENYFRGLKEKNKDMELSPSTQKLYGILKGKNVPSKKALRKMFHEKSIN